MDALVDAVAALNPQPRNARWASLSSCVVDAVWSIGALYEAVTVPITRSVFAACAGGHTNPLVPAEDLTTPDPVPLTAFLARFPSEDSLKAITNDQCTSPRGGIRKADAVLRYAAVLADDGIQTRQDALSLVHDDARLAAAEDRLSRVPGDGQHGVRRGYLWMLVGDDDGIKPDRMVMRWLKAHGVVVEPTEAKAMLREVAADLTKRSGNGVTPWMVDHAVWLAGRTMR